MRTGACRPITAASHLQVGATLLDNTTEYGDVFSFLVHNPLQSDVTLNISTLMSACQWFNTSNSEWSTDGTMTSTSI